MTLELKDICGYLPYGVKVYLDGKSYTVTKWKNGSNNNMLAQQDNGTSSLIFNSGRGDAKFILRPMSDLTKEIRQNGYNNSKPFIPIVELACMLEPQGYWRVYGAWAADFGEDGESCIAHLVYDEDHFVYTVDDEYDTFNSVAIYDKLNAWMFDYRGLISAGLAIDVNTLPENPYEL